MSQYWILAAILLPIAGGTLLSLIPFRSRNAMLIYIESIILLTSAVVWSLLLGGTTSVFHVIHFVNDLSISFKIDGMTMVFAGLVSILWPMATLYAFEYMEHEAHNQVFFSFYSMTYGVTLGIAFASDIVSMYFFYELLTLVTVPLVMHTLTREAILAVRNYLYFSLGGAAFAMMGMICIMVYSDVCEFSLGGSLQTASLGDNTSLLLWIYFFSFLGFGVKSALFPFSFWLPQAGVAPTPVTALLHAAAVVNAGAFGIIRLTYYCFGIEFLSGTWVQYACMSLCMFTIIYGCSRALKETHIKRRLAWSTVSNLSYILFGVTIMTPQGLTGSLCHFVFHGFMKMGAFLCAGAFIHQTGKEYIYEMDGMGKKMKLVFTCLTVCGLCLMGVPGCSGFISKWNLTRAAVESGIPLAYGGIACLLISALLTAIYMMSMINRAVFPSRDFSCEKLDRISDPGWKMCLPLIVCSVVSVLFGLFSSPLVAFFQNISAGIY